jgi:hypothetical protein
MAACTLDNIVINSTGMQITALMDKKEDGTGRLDMAQPLPYLEELWLLLGRLALLISANSKVL